MRLVIVESPYAGDVSRNERYLNACLRDCLLNHGEAPFASHAIYTRPGVLDDKVPDQRKLGMEAGWEWLLRADAVVVYTDLGVSNGMRGGAAKAAKAGIPVEERKLGENWEFPNG